MYEFNPLISYIKAKKAEEKTDDLSGRVDNIVADAGNSNTEIVDARGGKTVLKDRLDAFDVSLAQITKQSLVYMVFQTKQTGETDDTARIKRALALGNTLIFESGATYSISDTLLPNAGTKIYGNNATIINNITTSVPVFWVQQSNISIFDITVQNTSSNVGINNSTTQSLYGSAVAVGYPSNTSLISNIELENITVKQGIDGVSAIILTGLVENAHIKNCLVDGTTSTNGTGFVASFHVEWNGVTVYSPRNITFENCIAKNNTKTASHAYYLSGCYNTSIKNCKAENVYHGILLYAGDNGVETGKEANLSVKDCQIVDFTGYGIEVNGTDNTQTQKRYVGAKIDNNHIRGLSNGSAATTNGIRLYRNGGGVVITNNKIKTVNVGINADPCKAVLIDHNEFNDIWNQAINTVQMEKSFITRNTFKDISKSANAAATDSTIVLTYLSNDNIIEDNIFGYDGQSILPRFHIYIKNESPVSNNSINNKIYKNTFFATAGGFCVINGASTNNFTHINYVSENVITGSDGLSSGACIYEMQGSNKVVYHTGIPSIGTWKVGDRIVNTIPAASGNIGWVCTTAGTPGTWKTYGTIGA